jgi:hypothetical protein
MGLGSGIRKKTYPGSGSRVKKAPDPGSGSATLDKDKRNKIFISGKNSDTSIVGLRMFQ